MDKKFESLMKSEGMNPDTVLYRYTPSEYLQDLGEDNLSLKANEAATEMVEDIYSHGHTKMANHVGGGLSFTREIEKEFATKDHVLIKVRIGDIISQKGRIYPDRSTFTGNAYYLTMPNGSVKVTRVHK